MRAGYSLYVQNAGDWDRFEAQERGEDVSGKPVRPDNEIWREELELVHQVEDLGFDSLWCVEHHFTPYTMVPNPLQLLSYMAGATKRMDMGTMVVVLPWHDPIRVVEELIMLDTFLGPDRDIRMAVGRGLGRREFGGFGIHMDESRPRFQEALDIIKLGLLEDRFSYDGEFFKVPETTIRPRPLDGQRILDNMHCAWGSMESMEIAAANGLKPVVIPSKSYKEYEPELERYTELRREQGLGSGRPGRRRPRVLRRDRGGGLRGRQAPPRQVRRHGQPPLRVQRRATSPSSRATSTTRRSTRRPRRRGVGADRQRLPRRAHLGHPGDVHREDRAAHRDDARLVGARLHDEVRRDVLRRRPSRACSSSAARCCRPSTRWPTPSPSRSAAGRSLVSALAGRRVLVTGGSSGIGAALARACSDRGARVAVVGRDDSACAASPRRRAQSAIAADVGDADAATAAVDEASERIGGLDAVVNGAGLMLHAALSAGHRDDWAAMIGVNVLGVAHISHAALPHLHAAGFGDIINIASLASDRVSHPDFAMYAATKAAVARLTEALRADVGPGSGIRVSMIKPGATRTPGFGPGIRNPDLRRTTVAELNRTGMTPAEVAHQICHMLSLPRTACITEMTLVPHDTHHQKECR